jgi:CheY-like chemotaxis protein
MNEMNGPAAFRPVILAVDDEPKDLELIERELRKRYGEDYSVLCEDSAQLGLQKLRGLGAHGDDIAIVIAAQRMAEISGVEFLSRVRGGDALGLQRVGGSGGDHGHGAAYRRLNIPSLAALDGAGVFYGAATTESRTLEGQEVYVVGGANSAGQAVMHLSKYASGVTLLVRGAPLRPACPTT